MRAILSIKRMYLLIILTIFVMPPAAFAQENEPEADPYAHIPQIVIEEAQDFLQECQGRTQLSSYYQCECLALKFIDERFKAGPEPNRDVITGRTLRYSECRDVVNATGRAYNECLSTPLGKTDREEHEKFCACYANQYGKMLENSDLSISSRNEIGLRRGARISCMQ